ncbi:MAG TPA: choice-of-anchor V domain-containing protein [Bryobacteraceae bacterium]|nr:choice-of-anchor V domain-containing protein [Bryobacteraceae bacterium]
MKTNYGNIGFALLLAAVPVTLFAFSQQTGPPPNRTGLPENPDCTACHRTFPANSGAGRVRIEVNNYNPGVRQRIRVIVEDPQASRWGFQLTVRGVGDLTKSVGTFTPNENVQVICDNGTNRGVAGPCSGLPEYVQHTPAATASGTTGSRTFEVDWDPPASEMGDIIFFAAGNAANNNANNQGDFIYTTSKRVSSTGACTFTRRPTLQRITDAAGFRQAVAMNGLATIFGLGFQVGGTKRAAGLGDFGPEGRFPTELGCVGIEVAGRRAPVLYVQNDQINFQMPTLAQTGPVPVTVILNPDQPTEMRSDVGTVTMQSFAPSIFTFNGRSAAALFAGTDIPVVVDQAVSTRGRGAKPGDKIELYVTGLGLTEPVFQAGELAPAAAVRLRDALTATVGGANATVEYAGLAPTLISGLYQVNLIMPSLASGDHPVVLRIGGIESPTGVIIPVRP